MMSPQLPLLLLVLASSRPVRAAGPAAWRDSAIGASELVVLDGSDWHVSGAGRTLSSHCTGGGPGTAAAADSGCAVCEDGVNYTAPAVGTHGWYSVRPLGMGDSWTMGDCVELCAATAGCAAAVWTRPVHGHSAAGSGCGFRTAAEVALGRRRANGTTACVPADTRPLPVDLAGVTVPGDLVTDLQRAGKIQDPLFSNNHKDPSQVAWWNGAVYTYSKTFSLDAATMRRLAVSASTSSVRLVLNGVKMGATISLNGHTLGNVTNQHLRYAFEVAPYLRHGGGQLNNTLRVRFDRSIDTAGRFMGCALYYLTAQPQA